MSEPEAIRGRWRPNFDFGGIILRHGGRWTMMLSEWLIAMKETGLAPGSSERSIDPNTRIVATAITPLQRSPRSMFHVVNPADAFEITLHGYGIDGGEVAIPVPLICHRVDPDAIDLGVLAERVLNATQGLDLAGAMFPMVDDSDRPRLMRFEDFHWAHALSLYRSIERGEPIVARALLAGRMGRFKDAAPRKAVSMAEVTFGELLNQAAALGYAVRSAELAGLEASAEAGAKVVEGGSNGGKAGTQTRRAKAARWKAWANPRIDRAKSEGLVSDEGIAQFVLDHWLREGHPKEPSLRSLTQYIRDLRNGVGAIG